MGRSVMLQHVPMKGAARREHLVDGIALALVTAGVLLVTSLPYLFASWIAPADKQFMGILFNVPDTAQYLSWARESSRAVFIENKLTPEAGDAVFLNLLWLGVGRLAGALGQEVTWAMHLVRLIAGAAFLVAIYWFCGLVTPNRLQRWVSFLVVALGGGLGWGLVIYKQFSGDLPFPMDLYIMESNTFFTVLAFPHQAMAGALLVVILGLSALAFERQSYRLALLAGGLMLALGLQHGYDLLIVYAIVGSVGLVLAWQWFSLRPIGLGIAIGIWSVPAALYLTYITRESPIWRGVLAQYGNAGVFTPPPPHLLILLGLPLLLLLAVRPGATRLHWAAPRELILGLWLVVGFGLLYLPTNFQVKMLACWQVPVGILATRLVFSQLVPALGALRLPGWAQGLGPWRRDLVLAAFCVLAVLPVNLYLYGWRFVDLARRDYPYYLLRDEVTALGWLEDHTDPADVVLSSLTIGQYVPSQAGNRAFLAHWAQTLDFYGKTRFVGHFFDPTTAEPERLALLQRFQVRYVFHGPEERALGSYDPALSPYLERVFSSARADVYRLKSDLVQFTVPCCS